MASCRIEQVEEQRHQNQESAQLIPDTWARHIEENTELKPWDLEVIRNERRGKVQFSEVSYTSTRRLRQTLRSRTDGSNDINEGPATNPFLDPTENVAPDDRSSVLLSNEPGYFGSVKVVTPSGTFAVARTPSPSPPSKGKRRKSELRYDGPHPFVPGKARHKMPGEVNRRHFTQYVYSRTHTNHAMTHHYLCETPDLEKAVYYYHDVGGYTRLDPDHSFTLHLGSHSEAPILGTMWHTGSGMHFAVGNPFMNFLDRDNENVSTIQRQYCDYLKPISAVPSRWHMEFTFGGEEGEGPKRQYRWQVVHLAEAFPNLRHGKVELREKYEGLLDDKGKKQDKGKLLAACRNIDSLATNIWIRDTPEDFGNELARIKWKTWVLLTWGAMRDRMQGPHNTGSPYHTVGYKKSTRVVESPGSKFSISGRPLWGVNGSPKTEEIREKMLDHDEY